MFLRSPIPDKQNEKQVTFPYPQPYKVYFGSVRNKSFTSRQRSRAGGLPPATLGSPRGSPEFSGWVGRNQTRRRYLCRGSRGCEMSVRAVASSMMRFVMSSAVSAPFRLCRGLWRETTHSRRGVLGMSSIPGPEERRLIEKSAPVPSARKNTVATPPTMPDSAMSIFFCRPTCAPCCALAPGLPWCSGRQRKRARESG